MGLSDGSELGMLVEAWQPAACSEGVLLQIPRGAVPCVVQAPRETRGKVGFSLAIVAEQVAVFGLAPDLVMGVLRLAGVEPWLRRMSPPTRGTWVRFASWTRPSLAD